MLQYMEPGCGEYCKLKNWVDAFMQIPFNRNKNLPITIADGVDKCHDFMTAAKTHLDTAVYGLNDAKMQIMQMVGQWIANPAAIGTAVAIHGPPGTGKTSLVKEGISKILGRDFAFIALGGATDSSCLEGHSYTYEGSMWGKIVDILIRCKSSNPVIYFDELDKISETSKGEEIVGILTHLTDTSQNSQFQDKYFSEVAFDLSKCLFIFSYNDESRVNPVLLDRMYKIRTTGYSAKDKTFIAQNYLIPRIRAEVAFAEGDIVIPDAVVEYIVEHHTLKEAGVRNLKRCLETVYTKLNLHRLMRPGTQLFDDKETSLEVSFPYNVSREVVDKLIKKNDSDRPNMNLYL
jgi:ATP-dependent Lon protease